MYKVQKKDGSIEDFDRTKIVNGLTRAGASPEEAEKVATEIDAWLPIAAVDNIVNSIDIRMKGLDTLRLINPEVAAKFDNFQKPKED